MAELLAPAGTYDALEAAVFAGADAVYFGANRFNARLRAKNFPGEMLQKGIDLCHSHGAKAYITINTLIFENELADAAKLIGEAYAAGADAIILQDFAIYSLAKQIAPKIRLHASTQMTVHNSASAKLLASLGFKRINLARELSLEEIRQIKQNCGIEVETFVHGALCFSYSGQCLFSYVQTKRSGNRGLCSQLCRIPWKFFHEKELVKQGYLMNSKDLNMLKHMPQLLDAGIDSFKLEGRMKNPEYIYAIVSAYRNMLDKNEPADLSKIFNRGYTTAYYFGNPASSLLNPDNPGYKGEVLGKVLDVSRKGAAVRLLLPLTVGDGIRTQAQNRVTIVNDIYSEQGKKLNRATGMCYLRIRQLRKGDIIYKAFSAHSRQKIIHAARAPLHPGKEQPSGYALAQFSPPKFESSLFRLPSASELNSIPRGSFAVLPISECTKEAVAAGHSRQLSLAIDTPRIIKDHELDSVLGQLDAVLVNEPDALFISNLALLSLAQPKLLSHQFNITNSQSAALLSSLAPNFLAAISSIELAPAQARQISLIPFSYGTVEVMVSEHDLIRSACKPNCEAQHFLKDPNGSLFRVLHEGSRSVILSARPVEHEDRNAPCFIDLKYDKKSKLPEKRKLAFPYCEPGSVPPNL